MTLLIRGGQVMVEYFEELITFVLCYQRRSYQDNIWSRIISNSYSFAKVCPFSVAAPRFIAYRALQTVIFRNNTVLE